MSRSNSGQFAFDTGSRGLLRSRLSQKGVPHETLLDRAGPNRDGAHCRLLLPATACAAAVLLPTLCGERLRDRFTHRLVRVVVRRPMRRRVRPRARRLAVRRPRALRHRSYPVRFRRPPARAARFLLIRAKRESRSAAPCRRFLPGAASSIACGVGRGLLPPPVVGV